MILYFADRLYTVIGLASTNLPEGFRIIDDKTTDEVGTGFATFDYTIAIDSSNRHDAERIMKCGNYIFRYDGATDDFRASVIMETEISPIDSTIQLYTEDVGLDLLNGIAYSYVASSYMSIENYVKLFISDTGYKIGRNEFSPDYILRLGWDSDETITSRLLDIAAQFDAEIYCSFVIDRNNFWIRQRYINIVRKRGKDVGVELRVGRELSNLRVKHSMLNVATALNPVGATLDTGVGIYNRTDLDGTPRYTWLKFADNTVGLNMEDSGSGHKYIGIAIDKTLANESTNASDYKWRRIGYTDTIVTFSENNSGFQEVTDNDSVTYTWVNFSTKSDGSGMDGKSSGKSYIGIATGKDSATKGSDPAEYEWYDMREATSDRRVILIPPTNNAAVSSSDGYTWVKFGTSESGAGMSDSGANKSHIGVALNQTSSTRSSTASDYEWLPIIFRTANGGYSEIATIGSGVKIGNGNYVWYSFTDLENVGPDPSFGNYIGLLYGQTKASPMNAPSNTYEWHDISAENSAGLTLEGYSYDDGDFYIDGKILKSRNALKEWARDVSTANTNFGHIYRNFSCEAETQQDLLRESIKELTRARKLETTYESNFIYIPKTVSVGDYVRIVDRDGEVYLQARLLKLETSEVRDTRSATFGDYLEVSSGISSKVAKLAEQIREEAKKNKSVANSSVQTVTTYFISTDTNEPPSIYDPGWSTEAITQAVGQYVWQMTATTFLDGSVRYSEPSEITGLATAMQVYTLYYKSTNYDEDSQSYLPPEVPTSAETIPPEGWSLSEESAYEENSKGELYSVTLTTYSDGRFVYSDVYKVSTYSQVQSTNEGVSEAKAAAEDAKQTAVNAENHARDIEVLIGNVETAYGELKALLSTDGFTIVNEEQPTESTLNPKGLKIVRRSDSVVLAQFDYQNSYVDYLKVNRFLSFGAHRTEKKSGLEYDNTTSVEGTAFFWTGGEQ